MIRKRNLKSFCGQDFYLCDWAKVSLIPDPEMVLRYFQLLFLDIINEHAPLRKYKVKGHDNPRFSELLQ